MHSIDTSHHVALSQSSKQFMFVMLVLALIIKGMTVGIQSATTSFEGEVAQLLSFSQKISAASAQQNS